MYFKDLLETEKSVKIWGFVVFNKVKSILLLWENQFKKMI